MKQKYTNEQRTQIFKDHVDQFGKYDAKEFVDAAASSQHPAHKWFTWDDSAAARQQRIWEARQFVRGIKIKRQKEIIVKIGSDKKITVRNDPLTVSPISDTGYILRDTPEGQTAAKERAFASLTSWYKSYLSCLTDKDRKTAEQLLRSLGKQVN